MTVKYYLAAGYILSLGLAACAGSSQVLATSEFLASQNNFHQAYWVIANASETYPDDPEIQRMFWQRRRDYLLERGRELLYNEREIEAIRVFEQVLTLEPGSPVAEGWIMRSLHKLAESEVKDGEILMHEGRIEEALVHFTAALAYVPQFPSASTGVDNVTAYNSRRNQKAIKHYKLGSRARGEYPPSYNRSAYHSRIALDMDKTMSRAEELRVSSIRRIAHDRMAASEKSEEDGFYSAALVECKQIKAILPDYEGVDARIARLEKEVDARKQCRDAEMILRKGDFDRADALLAKAFDLAVSGDVKAIISGVMQDSKLRRYKEAFMKARDLELDWKLEAALVGYKAVEEVFKKDYPASDQEGFEGVRGRIREVGSTIAEANDAFAKGVAAEKASKLKEAIDHFAEAVAVYPGFKGLEARIAKLRAQLQ
ncbi:MAG: hypothetical protein VX951_00935 [Planctomycetota bacterium]|nr:hypothetical protein [Planctomycetota bacterium]